MLVKSVCYISGNQIGDNIAEVGDWASCQAARSLELLNAIDGTVTKITLVSSSMRAISAAMREFESNITSIRDLIPEEKVIPSLEQCQDEISRFYEAMSAKKASADADPYLRAEDGVSEAYAGVLNALNDAHETLEHLRWSIMGHNADLNKKENGPVLRTSEEIESFLRSL